MTDNDDGTYLLYYIIYDSSTLYDVAVTVNQDSANIKTTQITLSANKTSPKMSFYVVESQDWTNTQVK